MKVPRHSRTRGHAALVAAVFLLAALAAALAGCGDKEAADGEYYCPMHPTYTSDRPGDCPICNMRLVRRDIPDSTAHAAHGGARATEGAPAGAGTAARAGSAGTGTPAHTGHSGMLPSTAPGAADTAAMPGTPVPGMAAVMLDTRGRELAGIQTAVARRDSLARNIRTVGTVVPDEARVRHIHTRIEGYVEKLFVAATGQFVRKGEPILAIYSPELLASQEEFLHAREAAAGFAASAIPEVRAGAASLLQAARRRLELYEVPESFIVDLERRGTAQPQVTLVAQVSGYVTGKEVREGQAVSPSDELYTVTDLSHVWVMADFYENEATLVHQGQKAELSLPYASERAFTGRVSYVYPYLEPTTRTLKVRLEFANPDLQLKPAMYVDVTLAVEAPPAVMIPASAVLDSGIRQVVFVETAPNRFEPRAVALGLRSAERVEILAGVHEGEHVVVRANFLLDSESRLRGALSGMSAGHDHGGEKP